MRRLPGILLLTLLLAACGEAPPPGSGQPAGDAPLLRLGWPDLIPAEGNPDTLQDRLARERLFTPGNHDPFSQAVLEAAEWVSARAPLRTELDAREVEMAGLVVPLEGDATQLREFLLVPYVGACIHVPPPPANQLVWVTTRTPVAAVDLYGPVRVRGRMHAGYQASELGDAGYRLEAESVQPID